MRTTALAIARPVAVIAVITAAIAVILAATVNPASGQNGTVPMHYCGNWLRTCTASCYLGHEAIGIHFAPFEQHPLVFGNPCLVVIVIYPEAA